MKDQIDIALGLRMRSWRRWRRVTQHKLAQVIGVSTQQVQKYESGVNRISASMLVRVAEALDCRVGDLTGEAPGKGDSVMSLEMASAFQNLGSDGEREALLALAKALVAARTIEAPIRAVAVG
jgi:transcriptional regulator with XRE-family HTH domain